MYKKYYCKKCKNIPLIKTKIFDNDMKFMVKCKCNFNYLTLNQLNKNYYLKNINKKYIKNEKIFVKDIENNVELLSNAKQHLKIIEKHLLR